MLQTNLPKSSSSGGRSTPIPALSNAQLQTIYRLMVEEYGLGQHVLVENTGRALGSLTRRLVGGTLTGQPMAVLAGAGNCGAAGLVTARYLSGAGAEVSTILARPPEVMGPVAAHQQRLLTRMGV